MALRPEPFGALAYHYGNRRLNFLRSPDLVAVVACLGEHATTAEALESCGVPERRRPSFQRALAALAASDFLEPVSPTHAADESTDERDGDR